MPHCFHEISLPFLGPHGRKYDLDQLKQYELFALRASGTLLAPSCNNPENNLGF